MRKELLHLRPELPRAEVRADMSLEEIFQNRTLRPIIKYQTELLNSIFSAYCQQHKNRFFNLNKEHQQVYIKDAMERDLKFRALLFGTVIGMFTMEEYKEYRQQKRALKKRIAKLLIQKLQSMEYRPDKA